MLAALSVETDAVVLLPPVVEERSQPSSQLQHLRLTHNPNIATKSIFTWRNSREPTVDMLVN